MTRNLVSVPEFDCFANASADELRSRLKCHATFVRVKCKETAYRAYSMVYARFIVRLEFTHVTKRVQLGLQLDPKVAGKVVSLNAMEVEFVTILVGSYIDWLSSKGYKEGLFVCGTLDSSEEYKARTLDTALYNLIHYQYSYR